MKLAREKSCEQSRHFGERTRAHSVLSRADLSTCLRILYAPGCGGRSTVFALLSRGLVNETARKAIDASIAVHTLANSEMPRTIVAGALCVLLLRAACVTGLQGLGGQFIEDMGAPASAVGGSDSGGGMYGGGAAGEYGDRSGGGLAPGAGELGARC